RPRSGDAPGHGTAFAFALPPGFATASELARKEQATMATGSYTHEAASATRVEQEHAAAHDKNPLGSRAEAVGRELARYGLVVVIAWIGLMKFTAYEADGIRLYVTNSPLMSWMYELMSVRGFSALLGVVEVGIAVLIAARPLSPRA